jgi:8-oxo-dGTP pyrophosphatase MutT (NUDIX family)
MPSLGLAVVAHARLRGALPADLLPLLDAALAGSAHAAEDLIRVAPDGMRGAIVAALHRADVPADVLRAALHLAWLVEWESVQGAMPRRELHEAFRAARFPLPALPERVTIWRGGRGVSVGKLREGLSWTLDRSVACWAACALQGHKPDLAPLVIRATVPRDAILFVSDAMREAEAVVFDPGPVTVDGDAEDWASARWSHIAARLQASDETRRTGGADWRTRLTAGIGRAGGAVLHAPPHHHDAAHAGALRETGYWGSAGAGCVFVARRTGRFLLAHRGPRVEQPNTWGTWGGAIDPGEAPEAAALREAREEAGFAGCADLLPLLAFTDGRFRFFNFLAVVGDEFAPRLEWEAQGYRWCEFGDWPAPLHFGLAAVLADPASVATMQAAARSAGTSTAPAVPALLAAHHAIGWDFDGTLIGHPASPMLHGFIRATPERRHVIVTFRTHELRAALPRDLAAIPGAPPISAFAAVESIPDALWLAFEEDRQRREAGALHGPLTAAERAYVEWKGATCRRLGLTVLVDDDAEHVGPGCEAHGVALVRPDCLCADG